MVLAKKPGREFSRPIAVCRVRREKARSFSGFNPRPATFAPAGSNRSSRRGNEAAEAFGVKGHVSDSASMQAVTRVNAEQASKS